MESKNILVISSSLRQGGNSEQLADAFIKGAKEKGHHVEKITLANKDIRFCKGCLFCQQSKPCIIQDDVNMIIDRMQCVDSIVFASPIYFYAMSGQLKTVLDRTNPLFVQDYRFRDIYLLLSAADEEVSAMDGAIKEIEGWISCFENSTLRGIIKGVGLDTYGAIEKHKDILQQAYIMGQDV